MARLKATADMVGAIEPAVRLYEEAPTEGMVVETSYADLWLSPADWAEAFEATEPDMPHNEAREDIWQALLTILVDESALPTQDPDLLVGPFAHVVVDEAQELTDAEWQILLRRSPARSLTIVGDRAQARHGFTESWEERLRRIGLDRIELATLSINYRTPEEVMVEAEPVIRAERPDANVPTSIRSTGVPVRHGERSQLHAILDSWLTEHGDGIACVISVVDVEDDALPANPQVRWLTPELAKGLEFDLVVLVDPADFGEGIEGAVDRYVAMTRATQQLVVLTSS
ncbi:MAG: hypothetical protein QM714_07590 [Nocardioides sp.]|uniref:hypothetical protein n=1 Tax=Nocardioides sp. TaxID=35761 RepID=UPI0039E349D2